MQYDPRGGQPVNAVIEGGPVKPAYPEAGVEWGLGNRNLEHRHVSKPRSKSEMELSWSLGNRVLQDRHLPKPIGGGVEAGWHIGNRVLEDRYVSRPRVKDVGPSGFHPAALGNRVIEHHLVENARFANPFAKPVVNAMAASRGLQTPKLRAKP